MDSEAGPPPPPAIPVTITSREGIFADRMNSLSQTLAAMRGHEQGHHGWSGLYDALHMMLGYSEPALGRILDAVWNDRPHISDAHLVTLISAESSISSESTISIFFAIRSLSGTSAR
jgi:hypothetical protein